MTGKGVEAIGFWEYNWDMFIKYYYCLEIRKERMKTNSILFLEVGLNRSAKFLGAWK